MTSKTTKRALISSALAIVVCVAMLIGTTFAWFTDTASTAVNKIQSGNLKVSLVDEDGNDLTNRQIRWTKKIDGNLVPAEDILWEPGCTYRTEQFTLRNDGNLAVKYRFNVSFTGDTKLLEVLEFSVKCWGTNFINGFKGFPSIEEFNNYEGHLLPASESVAGSNPQIASFEFKVHMKEEAGNEYQGLSLGDINITVVATQYTYENDSFGNQYDKDATYPVVETADELITALSEATGDVEILLANDIDLGSPTSTGLSENINYTINLNGHTLSANTQAFNLFSGTMEIKNGTIKHDSPASTGGRFITVGGHATKDGSKYSLDTANDNVNHGDDCNNIEKATLNLYNVTLESNVKAITGGGTAGQILHVLCGAEVNLYNCKFKIMMDNGVYANHIDVYNWAKNAVVNVYEGTSFYGDPTMQAFKNMTNSDWLGGAAPQHVFIPDGYELEAAEIAEGDTYAWYTVVKK